MIVNKVEICGVNTSKLPVLKEKEKRELLLKMRSGDTQARETFIKGNLRLVLSVIQRFNNRGENVDDLFQVGCIGLMKSIDNFDLSQNVKFSTYAVPMIIQDPVSLFEPIYHDGGDAIYVMDQISDAKNSDDSWLENISIKEAMKKLNDREKLILTLRFFNGRTQMEVADEIGISQAQVSRLEKTALKHMKKYV